MNSQIQPDILISALSHEIRNPVTLISSYLQLIRASHPEVEEYEYWDTLNEEILHLRTLLADFSAYHNGLRLCTRSVAAGEWLKGYSLTLPSLIGGILPGTNCTLSCLREYPHHEPDELILPGERRECRPVGALNIHILIYLAPDLLRAVFDPDKLRQVLDNLVRNAAEAIFGEDDGRAAARTPAILLAARREGDFLVLSIEDNGCGLDPGREADIFAPFVTGKPEGTGLGLAISERIIQAHGGSLHVTGKKGQGTRFTCRIPC